MQVRKSQKNDLKALIEELEEKVNHSGEEIFNAEEIKKRNQEKGNKKQQRKKPTNTNNAAPNLPLTAGRKRKRRGMSEEE
jgi:hypothetical protein